MKKYFKILLFLVLSVLGNASLRYGFAQNNTIDSLKKSLSTSKDDTSKVWVLDALSNSYTYSYADTALWYAQEELQLSQRLNFQAGIAAAMAAIGSALTTSGSYSSALDFLYKSLNLATELRDTFRLSDIHARLSLCHREQNEYKEAILNIKESKNLLKSINRTVPFITAILASLYERDNQLDSALFYANENYKLNPAWSGLLNVLGAIHSKLGHNQQAKDFYRRSIPLAIDSNFQIDILDAYNGIANIYLSEENVDSAVYFAKQALSQKWGKTYPIGMLRASTLLANIYESRRNTDSTLKYLKITNRLEDSLFNQQKTREAQSFSFNQQLHQQELIQKLERADIVYRNRLNIYFLAAGLLILVIVAGGLWRRNIFRKKSFALLQKQKQEIDIQKTKAETTLEVLKSTQSQLIQSEKMASLGELTAGIAHEIQNPLNFVNNFSEVNKELLTELQDEIEKGNLNELNVIAKVLIDNEEKINHHGKRADAIVKGMLQHSRSSTSIKEPTDINALADEYLRLAFHGFKAKDRLFNGTWRTEFDPNIGKVSVIPQDIGRVLLNLYNNAFYAVNERVRSAPNGYEPQVTVITGLLPATVNSLLRQSMPAGRHGANSLIITVKDNGNGIPQKIQDKIFQPFFTTKPTGQGTGLGLSLSYDIVKAHGGEMKVESKEGEGTTFIIQLPSS